MSEISWPQSAEELHPEAVLRLTDPATGETVRLSDPIWKDGKVHFQTSEQDESRSPEPRPEGKQRACCVGGKRHRRRDRKEYTYAPQPFIFANVNGRCLIARHRARWFRSDQMPDIKARDYEVLCVGHHWVDFDRNYGAWLWVTEREGDDICRRLNAGLPLNPRRAWGMLAAGVLGFASLATNAVAVIDWVQAG